MTDLETALKEQLRALDLEYRQRIEPIYKQLIELKALSPLSPQAIYPWNGIEKGRLIHTRDGSKIGNAIVRGRAATNARLAMQLAENGNQQLWLIETDFGNLLKYTDSEIHDQFTLGEIQPDYDKWFFARLDAISNAQSDG